jgi:hypothetical protein
MVRRWDDCGMEMGERKSEGDFSIREGCDSASAEPGRTVILLARQVFRGRIKCDCRQLSADCSRNVRTSHQGMAANLRTWVEYVSKYTRTGARGTRR